jgi:hypothetical protein
VLDNRRKSRHHASSRLEYMPSLSETDITL